MVQSFAQVNGTVVIGGKQKGDDHATLEILSNNGTKGMMPPRATTAQITAMESGLTEDSKGLVIYDTDQNCLKTWLGTTWSQCNDRAEYTYVSGSIEGEFYEDTPVDGRNFIKIKINVTKPGLVCFGTYDFEALHDIMIISNPMYVKMTGEQELKLFLGGSPKTAGTEIILTDYYAFKDGELPDLARFNIDELKPKRIVEVPAEYTFVSAEAVGDYAIGVPVNSRNNYIKLKLNVTKTGLYDIGMPVIKSVQYDDYTDKDLLINTQGVFNETGEQEILLTVAGVNNNSNYKRQYPYIYNNYNVQIEDNKATIEVIGQVDINFNNFNAIDRALYKITDIGPVQGEYYWGVPLTGSNYMVATVNVTKPGTYNLGSIDVTNTSDDERNRFVERENFVKFRAMGTFHTVGMHKVLLQGSGITFKNILATDAQEFLILDIFDSRAIVDIMTELEEEGRADMLNVLVHFQEKPLKYKTAKCTFSATSIHGNYVKNSPLDSSHYIKVAVNITEPGLVHFTGQNNTSATNHVTFDSGLVYFDSVGTKEVILYGKGVFDGTNNNVDVYDVNNSVPLVDQYKILGFLETVSFTVN
ncbi:hypothetical protein HYN86_17315 [Flavobacterium fluviale]|uniref:Uncharacterized protein n=2 Tax=Flavobacterium fluviale TaxID=2249356 RepID=A0A344LWG4_9FLAO|nr:hypothetical protein HYN86_17315 [Flavobacterium fluviale]